MTTHEYERMQELLTKKTKNNRFSHYGSRVVREAYEEAILAAKSILSTFYHSARNTEPCMTFREYQLDALRTSGDLSPWDKIRNGCYGLNGEAGECIEILKKTEFQGHPFEPDQMLDELGDTLWYLTQTTIGLGMTLDDVARHNIKKREERYPDGFDPEKSIHRKEYENV